MKPTIIKTRKQIENIRHAGKLLTELLILCANNAKPGVSLIDLEADADRFLKMNNVTGSFNGYEGFPANLCCSVNDCVVHGIPDDTVLQAGDLLKIDAGVTYQGCIADSAVSLIVGGPQHNPQGEELIVSTKKALDKGYETITTGGSAHDFAVTVFDHIRGDGFEIIRNLTGHGVGVEVHEGPYIYNRPHPATKQIKRKPGMVVALEPITSLDSKEFVERRGIPRNLYTKKGDLGAQWEYTILITNQGPEILAGVTDRSLIVTN